MSELSVRSDCTLIISGSKFWPIKVKEKGDKFVKELLRMAIKMDKNPDITYRINVELIKGENDDTTT